MGVTPVYGLPYQGLSDAPHGPNLGKLLAEEVETELIRVDAAAAVVSGVTTGLTAAWTDYSGTFVWAGSGGNPAIGNGIIIARHLKVGKTVQVRIKITMGSTTTFGSGFWTFSLPFTATAEAVWLPGPAIYVDAGVLNYTGTAVTNTSTTMVGIAGASSLIGPATPFTWANTDIMSMFMTYEVP